MACDVMLILAALPLVCVNFGHVVALCVTMSVLITYAKNDFH